MTTPADSTPKVGDEVTRWDGKLSKIVEVLNRGIYGWLAEVEGYVIVEVVTTEDGYCRELSPSERHGKHKGHPA